MTVTSRIRHQLLRHYSTSIPTSHPSLTYLPNFLSPHQSALLLSHSLRLLSSPTQTNSSARKLAREYRKSNPSYASQEIKSFMSEESYDFSVRHSDSVITGYREMLVREGLWNGGSNTEGLKELSEILTRLYKLIPIPEGESVTPIDPLDPPNHLSLHLLHLSGKGNILPHVDNPHASGDIIVGVSLGSERVMHFKKKEITVEGVEGSTKVLKGPEEFSVLLEPGSVYIQTGDLRAAYTHDIPTEAIWNGKLVGGQQRMSLMLRDKSKLPADPPKPI